MYLSSLLLRGFRNYADLQIDFSPGLNAVYGDNAQGKTNLLEAIFFLATGKSHRTSQDRELIQQGAPFAQARATVVRKTGELSLELTLSDETRKQLKINGVPEKKIAKLVGNLAAVFFSPDDLQLVKGPPAGRRRFLDLELSQLSQNYLYYLITFNRALAQRNTVLKQDPVDPAILSVYDEHLLSAGAQLIARRAEAVRQLAAIAAQYHFVLSEQKERLTLDYQSQGAEPGQTPPVADVMDRLQTLMRARQREEIRRQVTLVGPHRDDVAFWIDGKDARLYGSQGQQRTAVLALKLAELQFMAAQLGEFPVLLLDDVASELDPTRRHYLLNAMEEGIQTFVSCTDLETLTARSWPKEHRLFRVCAGTVEWDKKGLS